MAANEFERHVRTAMEEFKIPPSGTVWEHVEEAIAKKKKRRRILFFLTFSLLGLALAGYLLQTGISKNKFPGSQDAVAKKNLPQHSETVTSSKQTIVPRENGIQEINRNKQPRKETLPGRSTIRFKPNTPKAVTHRAPSKKDLIASVAVTEQQDKTNSNELTHKVAEKPVVSISVDSTRIYAWENNDRKANTVASDSVAGQEKDTSALTTNKQNDQVLIAKEDKKQKQRYQEKIRWGVSIAPGLSSIAENFVFFTNDAQSKSLGSNNPTANPGSPGPPFQNQGTVRSSFAFRAAVNVDKRLSKRSTVTLGVGYSYFSDKIKTGTRLPSNYQINSQLNVAAYYGGTMQSTFKDRFHFIEVPLKYSWRVNRNETHFFTLDAGIAGRYLLSTNALVYDTLAGGIYYHNSAGFNRGGFSLMSGLSYHARARHFEWVMGPQVSLQLNKIITSNLDKRRYFMFAGVEAGLFFDRKKTK